MPLLPCVKGSNERIKKKSRINVLIVWVATCKIKKFLPVNIWEENQNASVYVLRPMPKFKKLCLARARNENLNISKPCHKRVFGAMLGAYRI